jgi:hypothetical protein
MYYFFFLHVIYCGGIAQSIKLWSHKYGLLGSSRRACELLGSDHVKTPTEAFQK